MVESKREAWHDIVTRSEDAGADGLELNFGCPHGMSERGMGSAVGQVPEYAQMITEWVKEKARTPVLVKLTPNITDIRTVARAAKTRRRRRTVGDQHHQFDYRHRSRHLHAAPQCRRQEFAWRLLRAGGEAHRVEHGAAGDGRSRVGAAAVGHWRHRYVARCGGVHSAGLRHGAGMHRRDALRLSHRRRHDGRPRRTGCAKRISAPSKISAGGRCLA